MAWLVLAIATVAACVTCAGSAHPASSNSSCTDTSNEYGGYYSLLQTDMHVTPKATIDRALEPHGGIVCRRSSLDFERTGLLSDVVDRMWLWVTHVDEANVRSGTESSKRFHKDFLIAALLITCVFPWSHQRGNFDNENQRAGRSCFGLMLPSGQTLRYASVLLLWLKHYWFERFHPTFEIVFFLLGLLFDFVDEHSECQDDMWKALSSSMPEDFKRLYPFYALHVVGCYLVFFTSSCTSFGGNLLLAHALGLGVWLLSVVFGSYLAIVLMKSTVNSPLQHLEPSAMAIIYIGCMAMLVLPRTLAAPAHGPWAWPQDRSSLPHSYPDNAVYELLLARRELLLGLCHFFFGVALARVRLALTKSNCPRCLEMAASSQQEEGSTSSSEADLWREFEDEAQRHIIGSFSINTSGFT